MSILERFVVIFFGFLIFEVIFIRAGFFLGIPIGSFTLISSLVVYCAAVLATTTFFLKNKETKLQNFIGLLSFILVVLLLAPITALLSSTYDTSWDGQGYHQSAVIALSNGWNPIREPSIHFAQELPSQIFAEGYPSALWEIQSSVYSITGKINSAKITNIIIALIASVLVYILLRNLKINKFLSGVFTLLIVVQPVYLIQLLTFMQDGFGYQLLVVATASLLILIVSPCSLWPVVMFLFAEVMLVSTKYSNLPVALLLAAIFAPIAINRLMNRDYKLNRQTMAFVGIFVVISSIFAYLPYIRNFISHQAIFYPTNIPQLMGSVKYNNVPLNIKDDNKISLLFYGIFSRSQTSESGDPTNPANVANLKVPFTFTGEEIIDGAALYNNRVGSAGPLYSGIVLFAFVFCLLVSFKSENTKQRYAIYISFFTVIVILGLALLAPTPNLLRYVNQLQLLPFALLIPIYAVSNRRYVKATTFVALVLIAVNIGFYITAVTTRNVREASSLTRQLTEMRVSGKEYKVRAEQFYSNYVMLSENNVNFRIADRLTCAESGYLEASSTLTRYCID